MVNPQLRSVLSCPWTAEYPCEGAVLHVCDACALACTHMHSHALTDTDELSYVSYVSYVHRAMALWAV